MLLLTLGGRVVIADDVTAHDATRLAQRLAKGDITVMQATPATWQMLISAGWNGDSALRALVGGERLQRHLADELLQRAGSLWNLYGPTETTVWSTCAQVFAGPGAVPIGNPIANTTCYVVDEHLNKTPSGVPGELLIAGAGLAHAHVASAPAILSVITKVLCSILDAATSRSRFADIASNSAKSKLFSPRILMSVRP